MQFNSLVMDHHPYVSDERFAVEEGVFGRRLVAGLAVLAGSGAGRDQLPEFVQLWL